MGFNQKIYLVGFMGCGKSTVGKLLAAQMGVLFADIDELISGFVQKNVADIFAQHGENYFRVAEKTCLNATFAYKNGGVIATGGGTPCFFNNMSQINAHGISIFLDVPAEIIAQRLQNELDTRPLLLPHKNNLLAFITQKLESRLFFYKQATHTIKNAHLFEKQALVNKILGLL